MYRYFGRGKGVFARGNLSGVRLTLRPRRDVRDIVWGVRCGYERLTGLDYICGRADDRTRALSYPDTRVPG